MYFILSILIFLASMILYDQTGNFDYLFKMLLISCGFAFCDSISSLSPKRIIDAVANYKSITEKDKDTEK